ncbi:MAG: hypothetical protein AAF206_23145 [Bacteroidota bacterium]
MKSSKKQKHDYVDVEVHEVYETDPFESRGVTDLVEIEREQPVGKKKKRKNKYGWAFFLCSMFLGLAFIPFVQPPTSIMAGLGIGFLFFVDPIYDKVMDLIERI